MTKNYVELSANDRAYLQGLLSQTTLAVGVWRRAKGLLLLDEGAALQRVAQTVGVCSLTVAKWRDRYQAQGLGVLQDKPRSGRPPHIDGSQRAKITALACSTPPEGQARWSVRLLQGRVVELGYVESISHDSIHQILKKTLCSHT